MNKKLIFIFNILLVLIVLSCHSSVNKPVAEKKAEVTAPVEAPAPVQAPMNDAAKVMAKPEVPVLCYHRIDDTRKGDYTVSKATFSVHMKILADSGYHSVSPDQLYDYLVYNKALPDKPVMITFDDSRSEHAEIAAPVMEKYGFKGTFFIMTITYNKKNYMRTEQIADLAKRGHTIGLHSWDHTMVTKYKEQADWLKQVIQPKEKLEKIIGATVDCWAYPNGVYDHKAAEELSKSVKLSFTLFSKRDSVYPLQTVRRIIVPDCSAQSLLKSMRRTFGAKNLLAHKAENNASESKN